MSTFGWDLLYRSVEPNVKNNQDVLVGFTHFVLISNGFQCIGLGESKVLEGNEPKSEQLPVGWNDNYALKYVFQGNLYNLKGTTLEDGVILNLVRVNERNVSMVQLNTRSVAKRTGTLEEMIPNFEDIRDVIKTQLIDTVTQSTKCKETSCQTDPDSVRLESTPFSYRNPSIMSDPSRSYFPINENFPPGPGTFSDPVGVGRNDLYPFGVDPLRIVRPPIGGGGGMLFQPPQGPMPGGPGVGLPPGAVPPGARFDPFRPPDADRYVPRPRRPDHDEFPPPGYDDMFM